MGPSQWRAAKTLLASYPSPSTCWRRLRSWEDQQVWLTAWRTFLGHLSPAFFDEHQAVTDCPPHPLQKSLGPLRYPIGPARQKEAHPGVAVTLHVVVRRQRARRSADGNDLGQGIVDGGLHVRVGMVTDVAHGLGEVGGDDEKHVDVVHGEGSERCQAT